MPAFTIVSKSHTLLPLAWRLHREGHKVTATVLRKSFRGKAWKGLPLKQVDEWKPEEGSILITDTTDAAKSPHRPLFSAQAGEPAALVLGGWLDTEGNVHGPHLWMPSYGAWPGGQGLQVEAGGCLWWPRQGEEWAARLHPLLLSKLDELKSAGALGLVKVGLQWNQLLKQFETREDSLGWGFGDLHGEAFVSELQDLGQLLEYGHLARKDGFTQVVVVSMPPWPAMEYDYKCNSRAPSVPLAGLSDEDHARIFWHDIKVPKAGELWTGGLDGRLATVRGHGQSPLAARTRAFALAGKIRVPGRQIRGDLGGEADEALLLMDELGWL